MVVTEFRRQDSMSISAIAADANVNRASYPGFAGPVIRPGISTPAISTPVINGTDRVLQVEIPAQAKAQADEGSAAAPRLFRSAKGGMETRWRADAAAPPTAGQASDTFSFADFLDVINPLQHIPGVNLAYQALTGDTIKPAETVAGGFLYGGALGGMAAIAMSTISELWNGSAADGGANDDGAAAGGLAAIAQGSSKAGKFGGFAAPGAVA